MRPETTIKFRRCHAPLLKDFKKLTGGCACAGELCARRALSPAPAGGALKKLASRAPLIYRIMFFHDSHDLNIMSSDDTSCAPEKGAGRKASLGTRTRTQVRGDKRAAALRENLARRKARKSPKGPGAEGTDTEDAGPEKAGKD